LKENAYKIQSDLKRKGSTAQSKENLYKNLENFLKHLDELDQLHQKVFNG